MAHPQHAAIARDILELHRIRYCGQQALFAIERSSIKGWREFTERTRKPYLVFIGRPREAQSLPPLQKCPLLAISIEHDQVSTLEKRDTVAAR